MERNEFFENYVNNIQANVFLLAYDNNYEIISFISAYMKSHIRKGLDGNCSSWFNQPAIRIYEEVVDTYNIKKVNKQEFNRDAVEYLGYFYSKWHFITGEPSTTIVRFLPPKEGIKRFYVLHQLDEKVGIEMCKNAYNNKRSKKRYYANKNNDELKQRYEDPVYYSFLSRRMLYKLNKETILNKVKYTDDKNNYDFIDENYYLGIKTNVIFEKSKETIIEKLNSSNELAFEFNRQPDKTIYFCFVFSTLYETNEEKLLQDIKEIRKNIQIYKRKFHYLYFYMLGTLYEIDLANQLNKYYLPFTKRERQGVLREMKEEGIR